jgi:hypothetical protein
MLIFPGGHLRSMTCNHVRPKILGKRGAFFLDPLPRVPVFRGKIGEKGSKFSKLHEKYARKGVFLCNLDDQRLRCETKRLGRTWLHLFIEVPLPPLGIFFVCHILKHTTDKN